MTTDETIETLARFESWREDTLLAGPDVSLTAYIRVLEAAEPDPRIAEVHKAIKLALNAPSTRSVADGALLREVARITEPASDADVEVFPY